MKILLAQTRRSTRGFSLVEFTIVLGVICVVLGGIWVVASNMYNEVKHQQFSEMLTTIVGNIRGAYAGRPFFESTVVSDVMPKLASMNVFPNDRVRIINYDGTDYATVISPFGEFTNPHDSDAPYNSLYVCGWVIPGFDKCYPCPTCFPGATKVPLFAIEALVSDEDCIQVIMRNSDPSKQPGLVAMYSNGVRRTLPFTFQSAAAACVPTAAGKPNYIDFVYRLSASPQ
jgi:type II secretory pathway pseudopilin PulG